MNNNPYLQKRLVELKQQEILHEVEQARLLREAGLAGPGLLARAVNALRGFVNAVRKAPQDRASVERRQYESLGD